MGALPFVGGYLLIFAVWANLVEAAGGDIEELSAPLCKVAAVAASMVEGGPLGCFD